MGNRFTEESGLLLPENSGRQIIDGEWVWSTIMESPVITIGTTSLKEYCPSTSSITVAHFEPAERDPLKLEIKLPKASKNRTELLDLSKHFAKSMSEQDKSIADFINKNEIAKSDPDTPNSIHIVAGNFFFTAAAHYLAERLLANGSDSYRPLNYLGSAGSSLVLPIDEGHQKRVKTTNIVMGNPESPPLAGQQDVSRIQKILGFINPK